MLVLLAAEGGYEAFSLGPTEFTWLWFAAATAVLALLVDPIRHLIAGALVVLLVAVGLSQRAAGDLTASPAVMEPDAG